MTLQEATEQLDREIEAGRLVLDEEDIEAMLEEMRDKSQRRINKLMNGNS